MTWSVRGQSRVGYTLCPKGGHIPGGETNPQLIVNQTVSLVYGEGTNKGLKLHRRRVINSAGSRGGGGDAKQKP